jgi:hypothetical protein
MCLNVNTTIYTIYIPCRRVNVIPITLTYIYSLEFALISVLKSLPRSDQYRYRYLLHKLDLVEVSGSVDTASTASMSTATTNTNTIPRIDSDTINVRNNNSQNTHNQYHHSYLTSKNDHCPACYEKEILAMAKKYFENLKQQITN